MLLLLIIYIYIIDVVLAIKKIILLFDKVANRKCYMMCEIP